MRMARRSDGTHSHGLLSAGTLAVLGIAVALCVSAPVATADVAVGAGTPIGFKISPTDNAWNTDVSAHPVERDSGAYLARMGLDAHAHPDFGTVWDGAPIGIPYMLVRGAQPKVSITFYLCERRFRFAMER